LFFATEEADNLLLATINCLERWSLAASAKRSVQRSDVLMTALSAFEQTKGEDQNSGSNLSIVAGEVGKTSP